MNDCRPLRLRLAHFAMVALVLALTSALGCGRSHHTSPAFDAAVPGDTCGSIRLTAYTASATGWCEFDRTRSFLPSFARAGLTAAIAEPWNGGSYGGAAGEACGECWEISTVAATRIVMIHDLCPIAGNEPCNGEHFHFDLASEAGDALGAGGMDEGSARRVPCPVTGNLHVLVNDLHPNYVRIAFMNHRIPIRRADVRGAGPGVATDNPWVPLVRSEGAMDVSVAGGLANGGTGFVFRVESTQGQVVESSLGVPSTTSVGTAIDLGVQFDDLAASSVTSCMYVPPGDVYVDAFGGIPGVRWAINPWGAAENGYGEVTSGCASGSCVRVPNLVQWSGFHLFHRTPFPRSTFATLRVRLRAASGSGMVSIAPSLDGVRCTETVVPVDTSWAETTIDVTAVCPGMAELNGLTIDNPGADLGLLLDDVRFVP